MTIPIFKAVSFGDTNIHIYTYILSNRVFGDTFANKDWSKLLIMIPIK